MTIHQPSDLLAPSTLPAGMPDFDGVTPQLCVDALRQAMALARERWDAIAASEDAPTIENTLEAVELSEVELDRVEAVFSTMVANIGGDDWNDAESQVIPDFVDHAHRFSTHRGLYARLQALRESIDADTDPEAAYALDLSIRDFQRGGIDLPEEDQQALRDLEVTIGEAEQQFTQACVKARTTGAYRGTDAASLGVDITEAGGTVDGDAFTIPQSNSTHHPLLSQITSPIHRHALLAASLNRANGTGEVDTRPLVARLAQLREQKAHLLGFDTYADLALADEVAPSVDAVWELLTTLAGQTQQALEYDRRQLEALARDDQGDTYELAPGDWPFYQEKLRESTFTFSAADMRPYLELERVVEDGVFYAAHCLYGLSFHPREDITAWDPDVKAWEVHDDSGQMIGLFLGDYYTRETKEGGAWMHELVAYNQLTGATPVIANTLNIAKPAPGEPTLLTWDEVITCFHEFGHALHGLFAATRYPGFAGTSVPRDFVEFPSQLNEMWAYHPQILGRFLRHWATGLPAPQEVVDEIAASKTFGQAFETIEYLSSALIDLTWHRTPGVELPDAEGVDDFEARAAADAGAACDLVPPRYRSTYFAHTFGGGYASAYCSYMWAELMVADMEEWIRTGPLAGDNAGLNRAVGDALREGILSRGRSRDPLESYRSVTGHEPDPRSVARRRGLDGYEK